MKLPTAVQMAALLWMGAAAAQAAELNLKLDPDLKVVREAIPGQKQEALVATVPLVRGCEGGGIVELDFDLTRAWYYAPLRVGVRSADNAKAIVLHFEKRDGQGSQCDLAIRDGGKEKVMAKWTNVECAKYRLVLRWQEDGKIVFLARQGTTDVFEASGQASSPWKLDEFFMRVVSGNDNGYIGYDCEEQNLQMRSQPGGGDYVIAAAIGFLSVKTIGQGTGSREGERPETKSAPHGGESPLGRPLPGPATGLPDGRVNLDPGNEGLHPKTLDKPKVIEAAFPLASTELKSFTASVEVEVDTWNHYASLRTGFRNSVYGKHFDALMSKGDDGLRAVAMDVEVAGGAGFRSTLCHIPPDVKSFTITFQYNAPRSRFKMMVSHDKRVLGESDWTKIRGYFTLDEFVVQVGRGKPELEPGSSIAWDPKRAGLRAVSHTGNEGQYKYFMDALVKAAALQTE